VVECRKVSRKDIRNFEDTLVAFAGIRTGNLFNNERLEEMGFSDIYPIAIDAGISVSKLKLANATLPAICSFILRRRASIGNIRDVLADLDEAAVALGNYSRMDDDMRAMSAYLVGQEDDALRRDDSIIEPVSKLNKMLREACSINSEISEEHRIVINETVRLVPALKNRLAKLGFFQAGFGRGSRGNTMLDWQEVDEFDDRQLLFLEEVITTLNGIIGEKKFKVFGDTKSEYEYMQGENPCLTATRFLALGDFKYAKRTGAARVVRDIVSDVYQITNDRGPSVGDYQQALEDLSIQPVDINALMYKAERRLSKVIPYGGGRQ